MGLVTGDDDRDEDLTDDVATASLPDESTTVDGFQLIGDDGPLPVSEQ